MARARPRTWHLATLVALVTALASPRASAQSPDELTRLRQVFADGRKAEGNGAWSEALEKFMQVAAVKMTPQVRFHIALCEENLGRLVSALRGFELATEEAKQAGSAAVEVATNAPPRAEAIRARVAKLHIEVRGTRITSKIVLDDVALAPKDLASEILVDPGAHVVEARDASGRSTFRKGITLDERASETIEVPVDDHAAVHAAPPAPPPPPPPSRVPVYVAGAAGVAALATSSVFFVLRANNIASIRANCIDPVALTGCRASDESLTGQGKTYTIAADTMLGVGLAGVATAGVLWFVLAPKKARQQSAPAGLYVMPLASGIAAGGSF